MRQVLNSQTISWRRSKSCNLIEGGFDLDKYNLQSEVTDKYSLRGRVFNKIREDILTGKYKKGEAL